MRHLFQIVGVDIYISQGSVAMHLRYGGFLTLLLWRAVVQCGCLQKSTARGLVREPMQCVDFCQLNAYSCFHWFLHQIFSTGHKLKKLVPWGTDGRLPLSDLDLDLGSGHTAYRRPSLIDLYLRTKFHWDRKKNFFEGHHWGFGEVQSRDTKTRINIKNPARSNLDIVL